MKLKPICEILGSVLTFAGGLVLTYDALTVRRRILSENGIKELQDGLEKLTAGGIMGKLTYRGKPLGDEANLQILMAEQALHRARFGLILITLGFLFDIVGKLPCEF